jgi:predicted transcriptional regulator of viral defense system
MARNKKSPDWLSAATESLDQSPTRVHSRTDLKRAVDVLRARTKIPASVTVTRFIAALQVEGRLREIKLAREGEPDTPESKTRYAWDNPSAYALAASLVRGGYLSHASAMHLQGLTDRVPRTIYVNKEQSPKPQSRGVLTQPAIDRAFQSTPRVSNYAFFSDQHQFVLLSGKNTRCLEVSPLTTNQGEVLNVTGVERTLIDIVVRPSYAGGAREVLAAFIAAKNRASIDRLVQTLARLDHTYPYHQAIGFFMDRAGFHEETLERIANIGIRWKFYLDYQMEAPLFNERWQILYPQYL